MKKYLFTILSLILFSSTVFSSDSIRFGGGSKFKGGTLTQNLTMADGTLIDVATYVFRLKNDTDTYMYTPGADTIRSVNGGAVSMNLGPYTGATSFGANSKYTGSHISCFGPYSGPGDYGSAVGEGAGRGMSGNYNVAFGYAAGDGGPAGHSKSVAIGYNAMNTASQTAGVVNSMALGAEAYTTASNQVVIGSSGVADVQLGQGGVLGRFRPTLAELPGILNLASSGAKIGIGTSTPDCGLQNVGFSRLGGSCPKIKFAVATGTTAAAEGNVSTVAHGLGSGSKILFAQVRIELAASEYKYGYYERSAGYACSVSADDTDIKLELSGTNSENILSKPFSIFYAYTE